MLPKEEKLQQLTSTQPLTLKAWLNLTIYRQKSGKGSLKQEMTRLFSRCSKEEYSNRFSASNVFSQN